MEFILFLCFSSRDRIVCNVRWVFFDPTRHRLLERLRRNVRFRACSATAAAHGVPDDQKTNRLQLAVAFGLRQRALALTVCMVGTLQDVPAVQRFPNGGVLIELDLAAVGKP